MLAQIDGLTAQTDMLTTRIEQLITAIPAAQGVDPDGSTGPMTRRGPDAPVLPAIDRLTEFAIPCLDGDLAHAGDRAP